MGACFSRDTIEHLREQIDGLDSIIADCLAQRLRAAQLIGACKAAQELPVRDPSREASVAAHYARSFPKSLQGGPAGDLVDEVVAAVLSSSRRAQQTMTVSLQGGQGSWSEEALLGSLPADRVRILHCATVDEAWEACASGVASTAWLAVHNTTVGSIRETDGLAQTATCWLESTVPIVHALMAPPQASAAALTRIEGHPLALQQCAATLAQRYPRTKWVETVDGAWSAAHHSGDPAVAVLGSSQLATRHGLRVLDANLADQPGNATTFKLLSPAETTSMDVEALA